MSNILNNIKHNICFEMLFGLRHFQLLKTNIVFLLLRVKNISIHTQEKN